MSGKIWQAVCWATNREGGGCFLLDNQCTKTGRLVEEVLRKKHLYMRILPVENPTCGSFKEYEELPEMLPLDFTKDDVTWVVSNISGAAGALGAKVIELRNWLLRFGYLSEEIRDVVSALADWMANPPPP